jgi:23S rRNA (cytosine1962-C5)-methyltransferase
MIPCLIFEDDHLLVVNKPAGMNTHAPGPFAGEGIYDWLRHREPRWADLAILHRLDKETSGVMVFGKTTLANRSLTEQFTDRTIRKKYVLLTHRLPERREWVVKSKIARVGERYASGVRGEMAETKFCSLDSHLEPHASHLVQAEPLTGRTHQIRVHAAENGFPILGDTLYGGSSFSRLCLHAAELTLQHPVSTKPITFSAPSDFVADTRLALRAGLIDPGETDAFRIIHGASDGWPGWYLDGLGDFLLSASENPLTEQQRGFIGLRLPGAPRITQDASHIRFLGAYHKILDRHRLPPAHGEASPQLLTDPPGQNSPERFIVRENGVRYELSFREGYSVGLFLDQRDNRRRLLTGHIAAGYPLFNSKLNAQDSPFEVLNTFAYTCGFSVCAAKAGARTTSLDLSRKYLEWGRRNFVLNDLDPAGHEFIYGDTFDWLRRLAKKKRLFDVILLDPPTFSRSKEHGIFRVEKDYPNLMRAALPLLKPEGILFASANAAGWSPDEFLACVENAFHDAKRRILRRHYIPQPPDFPVSSSEPAYLKTVWVRIG